MAGGASDIQVIGLDRLNASLNRLPGDLAEIAPDKAATIVGTAARSRAPRRTGRLVASFGTDIRAGVVGVSFGVAYAGPINFGVGSRTGMRGPHNIRATRFLTNAIKDTQTAWIKTYEDAAQEACDRVKGA